MRKKDYILNKSTLVHSRDAVITEVLYLTGHDLFIRFSGGDVRICDMSQFFQPAHSKQYYTLPEFKNFSYTPDHVSWGSGSYKIGADLLVDYSISYKDKILKLKIKTSPFEEQSTPPIEERNYDFSNVDFVTGEGSKHSYDSWEEMEAYFDAYQEAEDKFRASHPGIWIEGDDEKEIDEFSDVCRDFCKSIKEVNTKLVDALFSLTKTDTENAFKKYKAAIIFQENELLSIQKRLNSSLSTLDKLIPNPRRDRKSCAMSVTSAFDDISDELQFLYRLASRSKKTIGKTKSPHKEIYESLLSFMGKCFDLACIMDFCETIIENVLSVWLSVDVLSDIILDFCKDRPRFVYTGPMKATDEYFAAERNLLWWMDHHLSEISGSDAFKLGIFWMDEDLEKIIHYKTVIQDTCKGKNLDEISLEHSVEWVNRPDNIQGDYTDYPHGQILYQDNAYIVEVNFQTNPQIESCLREFFNLPEDAKFKTGCW
jgi:hypothetical protein